MRYKIKGANWIMILDAAIKAAKDGDVIEISSEAMVERSKRALKRMYPEKAIVFEIVEADGSD